MKILHVNFAKGFRGGERQTLALIQALASLPGIEQSLLVRKGASLPEYLDSALDVRVIEGSASILSARFSGAKLGAFDWVHAHEAKAVKWAFGKYLADKTPYVITRRILKTPKQNLLTRKAYQNAAHVVAISSVIQTTMQAYLPEREVQLIPDSTAGLVVDGEKTAAIRADYAGKLLVGHVGALVDADKGQSTIIAAARLAQEQGANMHFVLLGTGKDEQMLKAASQGLKNISFPGFQTNVGDWLKAFDIFVFPSFQEGLGSSILDAMAASTPVIASNVGGIPDIVQDEKTGLLVEAGDAAGLLTRIKRLAQDKALAQNLVGNANDRLAAFRPDAIAQAYHALYQNESA